jgi:hypothetical protein
MKYYFTYITTNILNGKQYIGEHSTNNLEDGYLGSGLLIAKAIQNYGKKYFKREILEFYDTKENAFESEKKYIELYETHISKGGYNISPEGGHRIIGSLDESTKKKIRKSLKNHKVSKETRKKIGESSRISQLGHSVSQKTRKKIGEKNAISLKGKLFSDDRKEKMRGWNHSDESKKKIGEASKNSSRYTEERSQKIWESRRKNGTDKLSDEHRRKISQNNGMKKIKI